MTKKPQAMIQYRPRRSWLLCLGVLMGNAVFAAEGDPLTLNVGQTFTWDDNVFRLTDDAAALAAIGTSERDDVISRTFAEIIFDKKVGRQQFILNGGASYNRYDRFSVLNYTGYNLGATWNWALGNRWLGQLLFTRTHDLALFRDLRAPVKSLSDVTRANGIAEYRIDPEWSVYGGAGYLDQKFSSSLQAGANHRDKIMEAGFINRRFAGNELGLKLRRTNSDFPNRVVVGTRSVDDSFTQDDYLLTVKWQVTGKSVLKGYAGYSRRQFDDLAERDFSTPTARLEYDWTIDPKIFLNVAVRRELQTITDVTPSSTVTRGVSAGPIWKPTEKITLEGKAEYGKADFRGDSNVVLLGANRREDTYRTFSVIGTYKPLRNILLSLSGIHERRTSNTPDIPYKSNVAAATAQISF